MKKVSIKSKVLVLLAIMFLFLCNLSECLASGGSQPLSHVMNSAASIIKAKVINVKKVKGKSTHIHIEAKILEILKGNINDISLLLNFQSRPYASDNGKVRKWYMLPQSGKELNIKKGETWFFFSYFSKKESNGLINIFRAEPANEENKIRDLLKNKNKQ